MVSRRSKSAPGGKSRSQRQLRVGEMLRHAMVDVLAQAHIRDADLEGRSITVTEVAVSPDLQNATVYVMSLGGQDQEIVTAALNRCAKFLRGELARQVTLRRVPSLTFRLDTSFDDADAIGSLLQSPRVAQDLDDDEGQDAPAS